LLKEDAMKYALSGRLVLEGGGKLALSNREFLVMAGELGFDGVDLRKEQVSIESAPEALDEVAALVRDCGLEVAVLNAAGVSDEEGLRELEALIAIAERLGCKHIRTSGDVASLQKAADVAAKSDLRLCTQMHTNGDYETVALAQETLAKVGRANFGVIIEPANLHMAGDEFSPENFGKITDHVFLSNIQSLIALPPEEAPSKLKLSDGTEIGYKRMPIRENAGMSIPEYFQALAAAGFDGYVNVLEPLPETDDLRGFVADYLAYLREVAG